MNDVEGDAFMEEPGVEERDEEKSPVEEHAEKEGRPSVETAAAPAAADIEKELQDQKDKYVRLYAEFENYRKRMLKDKEELVRYGNESLLYDLLPVIDNLEMAIKHASNDASDGLLQGVEITLKEFLRVLDRFGLASIEAQGKAFDPSLHHAMAQVERDDVDENTVVEEYRKGYMFRDKVLRPSLVAVSKKTAAGGQLSAAYEEDIENKDIEEEG